MRAIICSAAGGPEVMSWGVAPDPVPAAGELLVRIHATALNRADILQRRGMYPPPPGASTILGMEMAGEVEATNAGVMALLPGGGYAERCVIPAGMAMPIPDGWTFAQAAAFPEVWMTAFDNVFNWGRLAAGQTLLVHGGGSGVGTAAIQLARWRGAKVLVTVGSARKGEACVALGANAWIDYHDDWGAKVRELTAGRGVDVILDCIGGKYLDPNLRSLAVGGRLVVIGLGGGARAELDLGLMLKRRLTISGTTLRSRSTDEKIALTRQVVAEVLPGFASGALRVVVDRELPITAAADAHRALEASEHIGKIVLTVP